MKALHRMILVMLPGPFFGWLGTLVFLLLMQFLIRYMKDLVGKGLPFGVIAELVVYNLAYIVVLAVPMSMLLSVLIAFGRLRETNAFDAARSAGISLPQLLWPVLVVASLVGGGMMYFNNVILPEANFRARGLWQDIRRAQPGFALTPGVFYNGLSGYSILVQRVQGPEMEEVVVFDYSEGSDRRALVKAAKGRLVSLPGDQVDLVLEDGSLDRMRTDQEGTRYDRLHFERLRFRLDLSSFLFERTDADGYRTDRTMRTPDMIAYVDSIEASNERERANLREATLRLVNPSELPEGFELAPMADSVRAAPTSRDLLAGLEGLQRAQVLESALSSARSRRATVESTIQTVDWAKQRADRYRVEIHKKQSIAFACLVFALVGAALGLLFRRGSLAVSGGLALGIFLFYWVTLVQGEKFADRDLLEPWVGMWAANAVIFVAGIWLVLREVYGFRLRWRR